MNNTKILGLTAALALSLIAAGNLAAQTILSPTNSSTLGRYRSAADDFIRTDSYTAVKMDKWFGFASYANNNAALGYAAKIGDLYVAVNYVGTLWGSLWNNAAAEREVDAWNTGNFKTWKTYTDLSFTGNPNNNIGVLVGAANMGFRVFFTSTHQAFKESDIANTVTGGTPATTYYKSYETDKGRIAPQLEWAMTKSLIAQGIQPKVTVNLNIVRDYSKIEEYTAANASSGGNVTNSQNYFNPTLAAGLGGFTLYNQNGFKGSVDLDYGLDLRLYDNEYSYQDAGGSYHIEKIEGTWNGVNAVEKTYMQHTVTPSLSGSWSKDRIGLKAKLNLPLSFRSETSAAQGIRADGSLEKNGDDTLTSYVGFAPRLDMALQYKIIPNRLTLNAGGRIQTTAIGVTTVASETFTNGSAVPHSAKKTTTPAFGDGTSTGLFAGFTWNLTDNVSLDASTGFNRANGGKGSHDLNVFDTGDDSFLHFSSILVALKF
jgi:hypothetical protein